LVSPSPEFVAKLYEIHNKLKLNYLFVGEGRHLMSEVFYDRRQQSVKVVLRTQAGLLQLPDSIDLQK